MHHKICTLADILEPQQNAESLKPRKTAKFKLPLGDDLLKFIFSTRTLFNFTNDLISSVKCEIMITNYNDGN